MYLAKIVLTRYGIDFDDLLGLHFFLASDFRLYQLFTYMFVHGGLEHLFFNMFAVWMFGRIMEQFFGSRRFLFYYIVCGLGAGLIQEAAQWAEYIYNGLNAYDSVNMGGMSIPMDVFLNRWTTVGASGAVYGILLSFGMTFPDERMFIIPIPIPIKAKWFVMGYAVIELLSALSHSGDGVAHVAHLGGMLFGLALILYWRKQSGNHNDRFFGGSGHSYGGYDNYFTRYEDVTHGNRSFFDRLKNWLNAIYSTIRKPFRRKPQMTIHTDGSKHYSDMEWNRKRQQRDAEIDRILTKVKESGYEHLTSEEKRKLFDASER